MTDASSGRNQLCQYLWASSASWLSPSVAFCYVAGVVGAVSPFFDVIVSEKSHFFPFVSSWKFCVTSRQNQVGYIRLAVAFVMSIALEPLFFGRVKLVIFGAPLPLLCQSLYVIFDGRRLCYVVGVIDGP